MKPISEGETVILHKLSNLVVDDTARTVVIESIKAVPEFKGIRPNRLINIGIREGYVDEKIIDGVSFICPINKKGGEKVEKRPITPKERELCKFLIINKQCYKGKKIRGLDIWGIGNNAITLGNVSIEAFTDGTPNGSGPIHQCHNKEFHNFFKKINKENSFDDGVQLAKEIIEKYGYLDWEEERKKQIKEMYGE